MAQHSSTGFPVSEDDLEGRICYGGLDLSSTTDITAFVLVLDVYKRQVYPHAEVNPLGDWTGGTDVDSGATNCLLYTSRRIIPTSVP